MKRKHEGKKAISSMSNGALSPPPSLKKIKQVACNIFRNGWTVFSNLFLIFLNCNELLYALKRKRAKFVLSVERSEFQIYCDVNSIEFGTVLILKGRPTGYVSGIFN